MKLKIVLFLIIVLATILRVYDLGGNPKTLYGDEQAFAWNAWNILKTGQDEYGNSFPLQFKSFNDYKSPIPVYLLVPFEAVGGLKPFTIRLPIAIASVLTVLMTFFLVRLLLGNTLGLIASFLMAISPWDIHLSRGYFEATLALLPFIVGVYFFLRARQKPFYLSISALLFVITLYTYFTPRILLPPFILFLIFLEKDWFLRNRKHLLTFFAILIIFCLPLLKMALFDKGVTRFTELAGVNSAKIVEIVNQERNGSLAPNFMRTIMHNKAIVWTREIKNNYLEHFSLNFWYIYGDNSLRYFTGNMGMFYLFELPFFLWGLFNLFTKQRKIAIFFLGWILLAPIPASLVGRPFAVRSLAMLPAPFVFVSVGIYEFWKKMASIKLQKLALLVLCVGFSLALGSYLLRYYLDYPVYAATWWGYENKAAIDYGQANVNKYNKIFISEYYTGAALAYAVYNEYDPLNYRQAVNHPVSLADNRNFVKLGKFYFGSLALDEQRMKLNIVPRKSLYIGDPFEAKSPETIRAPGDNRLLFNIYKVN